MTVIPISKNSPITPSTPSLCIASPLPTLQLQVHSFATLHDTSVKRRSSSHYQVWSTPSLNTAPSLPSQCYSMGSLPLLNPSWHLYEEKELFTQPGIINTFTEPSYLTPLPTLQHGVPSLVHSSWPRYEEKELFTLPRIIHTFTQQSYLTPLPLLQHGVSSLVQHFMTRLWR